jgi:hypothetical protein
VVTSLDIDNDGDLDLIVSPRGPGPYGHSTPFYLLNPGSGDFSKESLHRLGGPQPDRQTKALRSMDLNGDGFVDMILGNVNGNAEVWMNPGPSADPNSAATFELSSSVDVSDIEVADMNGDGLPDIVMVIKSTGVVRTILNPGTPGVPSSVGASALAWSSSAVTTDLRPQSAPRQVEVKDLNKDGYLDTIIGTSAGVAIYMGSATSTSSARRLQAAPAILLGIAASVPPLDVQDLEVVDANGDGWLDIVCSYDPTVYPAVSSPHHRRIFYGSNNIEGRFWVASSGLQLGPAGEAEWDVESMDFIDLNADGEHP